MPRRSLPDLPPVSSFPVAPHRYLWDNLPNQDVDTTNYRAVRDASPYKTGEVIYVVDGDSFALAYIVKVDVRIVAGEWSEYYEVRRANRTGHPIMFAKRSYLTYPGLIQRAYKRAGLAPDLPESYG